MIILITCGILLCQTLHADSVAVVDAPADWSAIPVWQDKGFTPDNEQALCPSAIRFARQNDALQIYISGLSAEKVNRKNITFIIEGKPNTFPYEENTIHLQFEAESIDGDPWAVTLGKTPKCSEPGVKCSMQTKDTLKIEIPLKKLSPGPVSMNLIFQTLYFAQKDMVGRQANSRYPATGNVQLDIPSFPVLTEKPKISEFRSEPTPCALDLSWKTSLKCCASVKLYNRKGAVVEERNSALPQKECSVSFAGLEPGKYRVAIESKALNGHKADYLSAFITVPAADKSSGGLWLKVRGKYIVDANGKPFRMVGIARTQYHDGHEKNLFGPISEQMDYYRSIGLNCIRLALSPNREYCPDANFHQEGADKYVEKYVDPDVQAIIKAGLYVIIDDHNFAETLESGRARFAIWEAIARRYKDEPMVAVYELWNEPCMKPAGLSPESAKDLRQWYAECIKAVRKYDTRHIIMVSDWNAGWGAATASMWAPVKFKVDEPYRQVIFSKHMAKDHCNANFVKDVLDNVANTWNVPFLIGELELEGGLQTEKDLSILLDILAKNPNKYGVWLWRPHDPDAIFTSTWSPWAKKYASPVKHGKTFPKITYKEQKNTFEVSKLKLSEKALTTISGSAVIAVPAAIPQYGWITIDLGRTLPPGSYKFEGRVAAASGSPSFALYIEDGDKQIQFSPFVNLDKPGVVPLVFYVWVEKPFSKLIMKKASAGKLPSIGLLDFTLVHREKSE